MRVLVCEDDARIGRAVRDALLEDGLAHGVQTYRELLQHAEQRLYADDSIGLATFADDIAKRLTIFLSNFQAVDTGTGLLANTVDLTARTHVAWPADSWASEVFIETLLRLGAAGVDPQKHRLADGRNLYDVMQQALKGRDAIYGFRYDGHTFYGTEERMLVNGKPFDWGRPEGHFLTPEEYASATIVRNPDGMTPVPFVNRTNHHAELADAAAKAAAMVRRQPYH